MSLSIRELQKERQKILLEINRQQKDLAAIDTVIARIMAFRETPAKLVTAAELVASMEAHDAGAASPKIDESAAQTKMTAVLVDNLRDAIRTIVAEIPFPFNKEDVHRALQNRFQQIEASSQDVGYHLWYLARKQNFLKIVEAGKGGKPSIYEKVS
jgi:hypothetical protein